MDAGAIPGSAAPDARQVAVSARWLGSAGTGTFRHPDVGSAHHGACVVSASPIGGEEFVVRHEPHRDCDTVAVVEPGCHFDDLEDLLVIEP